MTLSLIWAMARNRVIGRGNRLPWDLPDEMRHFMRSTTGKPVIMGRRTWDSMDGHPLPRRTNIILSRDPAFSSADTPGAQVVRSLDEALAVADAVHTINGSTETMVIGGAGIYALALPRADRLYMTLVDAQPEGDVVFPEVDLTGFDEVAAEHHPADARNSHAWTAYLYERRGG